MDEGALFVKFWEKEGPATRKVLSRIPEGSDYRPDPKSRPAREIAWLIVREEVTLGEGFGKGVMEWQDVPAPATMKEVLDVYDRHHDKLTEQFRGMSAAAWQKRVPFMYGGQEIMSETAFDNAFGFLFDIIHHRGQISTYLRPMGSTVPQIYGPSADEPA
jgi:DinB family